MNKIDPAPEGPRVLCQSKLGTFHANYITIFVVTIISDLLRKTKLPEILITTVIGIPMFSLPKLRVSLRQKLALGGVFALGGFMIVIEIIRFNIFFAALFNLLNLLVWNYVATFTGLVVANLPILRPMVFKKGFWGTTKNTNGSRLGSSNGFSRGAVGFVSSGRTRQQSEDSDGFPLAEVDTRGNSVIVTRSAKVEVTTINKTDKV